VLLGGGGGVWMGLVYDFAGNESFVGIRIALHMIRYNYE
jgi:hypothetical protein